MSLSFGSDEPLQPCKDYKVFAIPQNSHSIAVNSKTSDDIEGDIESIVKLKNGQTVKVKLDDLEQFIKENRSQIAVQKIPNMGKRRG